MMHYKLTFLIAIILTFQCCRNENNLEREITQIDINIQIERFDQLSANVTSQTLIDLKSDYPFMFSKTTPDSIWISTIQDSLQQQLFVEIDKKYNDIISTENEMILFFQHLKYYYNAFQEPRVVTFSNYVDYRNKVFVTDTIILIALDTYLGKNHRFYDNIQLYIRQNFEPSQIVSDLAAEYAKKEIQPLSRPSLIQEMVYFGKILYFKDVMIPFKSDEDKIGYSKEQLHWALENEASIWEYFVERELLYETDPKLAGRFINPSPFTKFNLELDSESPGRLGQYIGWQIVKAFMNNNKIKLQDMLSMDAIELFNKSKFKPRK